MLGDAIVHLHWTPAVFWAATHHEFQAGMDAHARVNKAQDDARAEAQRAGRNGK